MAEFSDPEFQRQVWLDPSRGFENLMEAIGTLWQLYADSPTSRLLGEIFYDLEETEAADAFLQAFDRINHVLGRFASDQAYIEHELWPPVVEAARNLRSLMVRNDASRDPAPGQQ
jgi:hypothetical protein